MYELCEAVVSHLPGDLECVCEVIRPYLPDLVVGVIASVIAAILLAILAVIVGAIFSKRVRLIVVWLGKQAWHGFRLVLRIVGHSLGLVCRVAISAANGCRRLYGRVRAMRRERLKRRVIAKLRCYEARGELPAEQVEVLVQAIALL